MGEISDDRQTAATGPARGPDPPGGEAPVVGPLVRGLTVLRAMARPGCHRLRPSDLVHATGLARATVDRVVGTLVRLDLLRAAGRDVEITPRLLAFGNAYLAGCGIADALEPFAERLADELDESVSVAVPDGTGVRFVTQVIRRRAMTPVFRIGDLLPADRCAAGMVLGRDAPEWAVDDQRMEQGLIAVAVPVRDPGGRRICGVSVVSNTGRHTAGSLTATALPRLRALLPAMEAAVAGALSGPPLPRPGAGTRPAGAARSDAIVPGPGPTPRAEPAPHGPAPADPAPHESAPHEPAPHEPAPDVFAPPEPAPHEPAPDVLAAKRELGAGFLQSLARGLDVLAVLGRDPRGLTLSAAAEATGQPRATARRALLTLQHLGYVTSQERRFRLLPRVLELGYAHLSGLDFTDIVQPHLERLAERVHESASVAVLDGHDIRYVARVPTYRIMSVNITVGTRFPATATSMGRVLLAGLAPGERAALLARAAPRRYTDRTVTDPAALAALLDDVAEQGHALVDEELEKGLRALAVPLRDGAGRTVAALNVSTYTGRGSREESRARLLPALAETAADIGDELRIAFERRPLRPGGLPAPAPTPARSRGREGISAAAPRRRP